jgi:hypothetical protein
MWFTLKWIKTLFGLLQNKKRKRSFLIKQKLGQVKIWFRSLGQLVESV